jgi:hypothetical protein
MRQRSYFYLYFGEYVVTDRHGYSPAIFAAPGQQFLKHARYPEHRDVFDLNVADWEWDYYDFVLVQTNKDDPNVPGLSDHASLAASTPDFRLFRIDRASPVP